MPPSSIANAKPLSRRQRVQADATLCGLWDKRSIPHVPEAERARLSDADLCFLIRFWSWKDRTWDSTRVDLTFTEEPPKGYEAMNRESRRMMFNRERDYAASRVNTATNLCLRQRTKLHS